MEDVEIIVTGKPDKPWLWQRGQSGNPSGPTKEKQRTLRYAQGKGFKAIQRLVSLMDDPKAPKAVQLSAAMAVLDRAFGKPKQALEIENQGETLEQLLTAIWDERERRRERSMLDVTPTQHDDATR